MAHFIHVCCLSTGGVILHIRQYIRVSTYLNCINNIPVGEF